jgi:RNA polymerase sigma factor (sigma-70 family)
MSQSPSPDSKNKNLNDILTLLQSAKLDERERGATILHQQYGQKLLAYAKKLTGNQQDAEDLLQECFTHLVINKVQELDHLNLSFLFRMILGLYLNFRRGKKRKRIADVEVGSSRPEEGTRSVDPVDLHPSPDQLVADSEAFKAAWGQLSEQQQRLLRECLIDERTLKEVAAISGVCVKTIQNRLKEAKERLAKLLTTSGWEVTLPPESDQGHSL